jgi:uncharacterized SAM-binding protein YcdF (DUF218 family)
MAVAVVAGLYVVGFLLFVLSLPKTPAPAVHGDGIVALTGGDARLDAAAALLENGAGKRLLISGVHPTITKDDIKRLVHGGRRFDCCADLGFSALSTRGNAAEAATWAHAHGYRSLVIVTANYHMPRSLHEFATEMPGTQLLPYPVEQDDVDLGEWWSDPHTLRVLHTEYAKYLGSLFFTALTVPHEAHRDHWHAAREARNGY